MKVVAVSLLCFWAGEHVYEAAETRHEALEQELSREGAASLARGASKEGDAKRGAVVFHRRRSTCTQCHAARMRVDKKSGMTTIGIRPPIRVTVTLKTSDEAAIQ